MNRRQESKRILLMISALVLATLACFHLTKGFYSLVVSPSAAGDMNWRYQEIHLFWKVPIDAQESMPLPRIQRWDKANYLPSSHIFGTLFIPPLSWAAARYYFAGVNILALITTVMVFTAFSRPLKIPIWLLAAAILACSNLQTTLAFGQYGIIVLALLSWGILALSRGNQLLGVLLLSFATVKPVLCLPLFVALIMFRQWRTFLASSLIAVSTLLVGFFLSAEPISAHLANYRDLSMDSIRRGYGLNTVLVDIGVPTSAIIYLGLILVLVFFFVLSRYRRSLYAKDPFTFFALASFAGRAWFPCFQHDNVMFIPLMVAVLREMFKKPSRATMILAASVGLSLWIPGRWMNYAPVEIMQWITWAGSVAFLCGASPSDQPCELALCSSNA